MRIAIHHSPESYSTHWIEYCKQKGIEYKIVNVYDSNVVEQVSDCDAFMWHHPYYSLNSCSIRWKNRANESTPTFTLLGISMIRWGRNTCWRP